MRNRSNNGAVSGVNRLVQFQPQIFVGVELPGLTDEDLSNLGVDAPVAFQVGVRQRVAGDVAAKAHMIEPWVYGAETNFDIAQLFDNTQRNKKRRPGSRMAKCF